MSVCKLKERQLFSHLQVCCSGRKQEMENLEIDMGRGYAGGNGSIERKKYMAG